MTKIHEAATGSIDGPKPLHEMTHEEFAAYRRTTLEGLIAAEKRRRALAEAAPPVAAATPPQVPDGPLHREQLEAITEAIWRGAGG